MKKVLLLMTATCFAMTMHAQKFQRGTNIVSAGIGLGSAILNYSGAAQTPALSLQYERGIWDMGGPGVVSLGGYVGYKGYSYSGGASSYKFSEKWHYTVVGIRSAYHYTGLKVDNLDVYGGVMLAYNLLSYSYSDNGGGGSFGNTGTYGSTVGLSLYVGGRYYFSDNLAVLAELGYGVAYLNAGIALKF
ncbi:MAG: hypothetical protein Q8927_20040 [Bacteroidota bacterium]|nr:hypothetical protein [Bacteroidota bacterium]MDP4245249.1 hypothetical protein [Bacteroidota bacterium]MDP4255847.1 hypothetical protein [Bacteroidota bacterium]MDP4260295.1 hypothetical protein [Bacteroidota bacterium]